MMKHLSGDQKMNDNCGDMNKNKKIMDEIGRPNNNDLRYRTIETIKKEPIKGLIDALQTLQTSVKKTITLGNVGELITASMLKMKILNGITKSVPDAIVEDKNPYLKKGRYQIKYRNEDTSDVEFRIDINGNGKLLQDIAWDYLLIATHKKKKIMPDKFYCVPYEDAMKLSEDLGEKKSGNGQNKYHLFRINWKFNRKGKGNTGSKKECIERKYKLKDHRNHEKIVISDVDIVEKSSPNGQSRSNSK